VKEAEERKKKQSEDENMAKILFEEEMRLAKEQEMREKMKKDEELAKKFREEELKYSREAEERKKKGTR